MAFDRDVRDGHSSDPCWPRPRPSVRDIVVRDVPVVSARGMTDCGEMHLLAPRDPASRDAMPLANGLGPELRLGLTRTIGCSAPWAIPLQNPRA